MSYNPDYKISLSLYIVRHGCSKANEGTAGDSIDEKEDPPLSGLGTRQAELLGKRFSRKAFDCIISSPLRRAVETASSVAENQPDNGARSVEIHPLFCEVGISEEFEGKTFSEIKEKYLAAEIAEGAKKYDRFICHTVSGNSSKERAMQAIDYLKSRFHSGESVVVVAHGGFNRYLLEAALNIDFDSANSDPTFFNSGVTKINFFKHGEGIYGNDVTLVYMNDHSHLAEEMPDLSYDKA